MKVDLVDVFSILSIQLIKFCCHLFSIIIMIASKRTQSLLDFRHILPPQMALPSQQMRAKTPITDLDAPDAATPHSTAENQSSSMNNTHHNHNTQNNVGRKTSIPTVQSKNFHSANMEEEKHSIAGDPIYQTISSEKGAKLGRNCISLENLRTLTIKNDLNSYGNNLLQNHGLPHYVLPAFPPPAPGYNITHYFSQKPHTAPHYMFGPSPYHPPPMAQPPPMMAPTPQQSAYFHQNYRMPFTNYGGYAHPNPYSNLSNTNSRQSIGNESDDYRKYRDVAL